MPKTSPTKKQLLLELEDLRSQIEETRKTLRGILNATQESIWLFSPEGIILLGNETALSRLHLPAEEVIGQPFKRFMPTELAEARQKCLNQVAETGNPFEMVDERNGIIFHHNFYPIKDADGRVVQVVAFSRDITERKRAEEALRESEERYRTIVETTSEGIWMTEVNGTTIFVNQRMADMLGYSPEEMRGRNGAEFLSPKDRSAVSVRRAEVAQGKNLEPELELQRKDGGSIWTIANVTPLHDKQGRHIATLSMHTDITERKHVEEALRESEQKYSLLFNKSAIPIALTKLPEKVFINVNEAFENLFGYTGQEIIGKTSLELGIARPEEYKTTIAEVEQQGFQKDTEKHVFTKTGEELIVLVNINTLDFGSNKYALSTMEDITERKRAEEEIRISHAKVIKEKNLLAAVLEVLPVGIAILNEQGGSIQTNNAYEEIWGSPRPDVKLVGDYSPYKAWWTDTGKQLEPQEWASARAIQNGEIVIGQLLEIERFDGQHRFVLNSGVPIRDELGRITGSAVAIMDVTALKQTQADLSQAKESLRLANLGLQQALAREQEISRTDSLTGVHNRRYFFEFADYELSVAKRYGKPLSMIMFDIDHFKQFNDNHGHQAGDEILKYVAKIAQQQLRDADILARYGGEEFTILLPRITAQESAVVAERIREIVAAYPLDFYGRKLSVTISLGVTEYCEATTTLDKFVQQADKAMYAAKAAGRNCVVIEV